MFLKFKTIFLHSWIKYLSCVIYGIVIIVVYNSFREWSKLVNYIDAIFIAGFSLVCIGGLSIVNNLGTFDIFTHMFVRSKENQPKPSLYEYSNSKKEKRYKNRFYCIPYFVLGVLYIIISVILQAFL
ncbi:MAG: DUF3899 domain-containing protein [Anaeroplasmataceae bacterium]|nr:DUF3899 domain-containing protein [Anaeroplasmataceae bacterium]